MPKRIENLHGKVLDYARRTLMESGYDALTVRSAAKACEVAVGTVYNYYPSKSHLALALLKDDWKTTVDKMGALCEELVIPVKCLEAIHPLLQAYIAEHRGLWLELAPNGADCKDVDSFRVDIMNQLAAVIQRMLQNTQRPYPKKLSLFLAGNLLTLSDVSRLSFAEAKPLLEKLLD